MKKYLLILLSLLIVAAGFTACSGEKATSEDESKQAQELIDNIGNNNSSDNGNTEEYSTEAAAYKSSGKSSGKSFEAHFDTMEYAFYYDIFYNQNTADYEDKPVIKTGTFSTLYDEYNGVTRYYVWGYNDQTKCCDWQWEIKPDGISSFPANGSLVEVKGTFSKEDAALDGYWITDAEITIDKKYTPPECDIDMSTMGGTLERVQAFYIQNKYETLNGKSVVMYGRVASPGVIEHPYYDGAFEIPVETEDEMPAIGIMVMVSGTVQDGKIVNAKVSVTEDY